MATKQKTAAKKKLAKARPSAAAQQKHVRSAKAKVSSSAAAAEKNQITWLVICFTFLSLVFLAVAIWRRG